MASLEKLNMCDWSRNQ